MASGFVLPDASRPLAAPFVVVAVPVGFGRTFAGIAIFLVPVQAQAAPCDETFYPLGDNLGSVNTLTDHLGNVVLTQHFLPFGEDFDSPKPQVSTCNNSEPWPYGFTGQYHDQETSLIYFHARYYNPAVGHFMQADSVVPNPSDTYSYDRYAYCRNNPINLTDPTGHDPIIGAIVGAIVGGLMAWINGGNILEGMAMGAIAGACFGSGWYAHLGTTAQFWTSVAIGAGMGAGQAALSGGNVFQAALIGGAGAAIGFGVARWGGLPQSQGGLGLGNFGKSVLGVMSGGMVGGLSSAAMGGDFWQGFTQGALSAGLSFAANEIAGEIKSAQETKTFNKALAEKFGELYGVLPGDETQSANNAQGTKIEDPFSILDSNGTTLGVTGPPGEMVPGVTNSPTDTADLMRGVTNYLKARGLSVTPTPEVDVLSNRFAGGASSTNLLWSSHASSEGLRASLYGPGIGISPKDMAAAINNAYSSGQITGRLNVLFLGCNTSGFAGSVYNALSPAYRPLVTLVGASGLLKWSVTAVTYQSLRLQPVGGWYRYP